MSLSALAAALADGRALADEVPPAPLPASHAEITFHLASGRTFAAALDARTDATQLWLRFERPGAEILRPIGWDCVASAELAGQQISGQQFRRAVERLRQEIPAQAVEPIAGTDFVLVGSPQVEPSPGSHAAAGVSRSDELPRVTSLVVDAAAGRWDENCDTDGIVVHVYPLAADGTVVPVRGTLNVDLTVQRNDRYRLCEPFVNAGHWAEPVQPADFGPMGAVYRLRFLSVDPEFNHWVAELGAVHATLAIPGQGTFEGTADMTYVRPYSAVRNRLEQSTGHRYFPNERTDDGRH